MDETHISVAELDKVILSLEARRGEYVLGAEKVAGNSTRARVDRQRLLSTATGLALALGDLRNMRAFAVARDVPDIPVITGAGIPLLGPAVRQAASEVVHEHGPYPRHTHLSGSESHEGVPQE
jgi:hypothetical protein